MQTIAVARNAMATRFEIVVHGDNPIALRAAGEEALDEIERLEAQLSLYRPTSEIARLNARAANEAVRVTPGLFRLLEHARNLSQKTGGAFDITIAPLVRCWGFMDGVGQIPHPDALAEARAGVGFHLVELNETDCSVRFARKGVMLDLGAIGKGYAIERAAELLREAGVTSALLNGGTSSIYALGRPPEANHWKVAVEYPSDENAAPTLLAAVPLRDEALSVSAVWGRFFKLEGKVVGHVLDPRIGQPVAGALLAAVVLPSVAETDALSTALLVVGEVGFDQITSLRPNMRALLLREKDAEGRFQVKSKGIELNHAGN